MDSAEKKDLYIAAAVGGLGLIAVLAIMHSGAASAAVTPPADSESLPSATLTPPQLPNAYNYNIAPYNPSPGIALARPVAGATDSGGGCCDTCGPVSGANYSGGSVAVFTTLINGLTFQPTGDLDNPIAVLQANAPAPAIAKGGASTGLSTPTLGLGTWGDLQY